MKGKDDALVTKPRLFVRPGGEGSEADRPNFGRLVFGCIEADFASKY